MKIDKPTLEQLCVDAGHVINRNNGACPALEDFACRVTTLCVLMLKKIGRENLKVDRENPTAADLINLAKGDVVLLRHDDGSEVEHEVRIEPWLLGHGEWIVGLVGISGGYALHRVVKIVRFAGSPETRASPEPRDESPEPEKQPPASSLALGSRLSTLDSRRLSPVDSLRCVICGWPLAETAAEGCVIGNCAERPRPKTEGRPQCQ